MNRLVLSFVLVTLLAGCGGDPPSSSELQEGQSPSSKQQGKRKPPPKPEPVKIEVAADAYASIDDAIAALLKAAEANESMDIVRTCTWLEMQGQSALAPLRETFQASGTSELGKYHLCRALRHVGAVDDLITAMQATDSARVKRAATVQLGQVQARDQATIDKVVKALLDEASSGDGKNRTVALNSIQTIGPPAESVAFEPLRQLMLNDDDSAVRQAANRALRVVSPRKTFVD